MKKMTLLIALAFLAIQSNAQEKYMETNFIAHELIGLKIVANRFNAKIYKKIKYECNDMHKDLLYLKEGFTCSDLKVYKNDTFLILDTISTDFHDYKNENGYNKFCTGETYLKAINLQKLDTCYIKYENSDFEKEFFTEININKLFKNKGCSIDKNIDDFTNEIRLIANNDAITISKYINKGVISYYISLEVKGYSPEIFNGVKTIQILFEDNTKMVKSGKIDTDVASDGNYKYSSFCSLTKQELAIFQKKLVKKIRLQYFDGDIDYLEALNINHASKCIETVK
jgi:hypothetical protein